MKRSLRSRRWAPSIAAVAAFGVLGATCAYWALQSFAPPIAIAPTGSLVDTRNTHDLAGAQALFGSSSSQVVSTAPADLDIRVLGVAASPSRGSVVLVVDSGPARAFLVGDEIDTGLRLVEVRSDAAVLERNGTRIELPAPQRPSVALLSSGPADAAHPASANRAAPNDARAPGRDVAGTAEDGPLETAAQTPRGGGPAIDPARASGIRGGSVRAIGSAAGGQAPASGALR